MKRFTTLIALLSVMLVAVAQRPLVTLSHNGELSFFSNLSAFEEALDSAQNGDIIYLSEGKFALRDKAISINKRLSIVGCGYKSHIVADILINMSKNSNSFINLPLFDGVRIQTLTFENDTVSRNNLKEVEIKKTWIKELNYGGYAGNTVLIDKCLIEYCALGGSADADITIQNSKIVEAPGNGLAPTVIINCNIDDIEYCPRRVFSSIISRTGKNSSMNTSGTEHCIIYNSLFRVRSILPNSYIETYNCYFDEGTGNFFDDNLEPTIDLAEKGYLGEDGTVVGVYGGEFPFSENPSVPTVDSANSKVEYDAENNKLNVTISVTPN